MIALAAIIALKVLKTKSEATKSSDSSISTKPKGTSAPQPGSSSLAVPADTPGKQVPSIKTEGSGDFLSVPFFERKFPDEDIPQMPPNNASAPPPSLAADTPAEIPGQEIQTPVEVKTTTDRNFSFTFVGDKYLFHVDQRSYSGTTREEAFLNFLVDKIKPDTFVVILFGDKFYIDLIEDENLTSDFPEELQQVEILLIQLGILFSIEKSIRTSEETPVRTISIPLKDENIQICETKPSRTIPVRVTPTAEDTCAYNHFAAFAANNLTDGIDINDFKVSVFDGNFYIEYHEKKDTLHKMVKFLNSMGYQPIYCKEQTYFNGITQKAYILIEKQPQRDTQKSV